MNLTSDATTRTLIPATLAHLQTWVGKTETLTDTITPAPLRGLSATLDRDADLTVPGSPLPPLWHWLYFLPQNRQSEIGADGHPTRGGFLPPVPLPRRMWAGGRLRWETQNPLRVGDSVRRESTIVSVTHKAGRTGDLLFVLVKHEVHNANGLALTEEHDIVYRAAALPGDPVSQPEAAKKNAAWQRELVPDDVLLFRYSALTFNGHRIHYDRHYVTEVEGYPGLIVHGPLIATLLVDLARRQMPGAVFQKFDFKAVRPTFAAVDAQPLRVNGQPEAPRLNAPADGKTTVKLWAEDHEGWLTMQATAELI